MPFVVKITNTAYPSAAAQWIGSNTRDGRKCVVARDEAQVFNSAAEAKSEIGIFELLLPTDAFRLELENS